MPFATRYSANDALETTIGNELEILNRKHKNGFLVRLHILGDFYSVDYVKKWAMWLNRFPNLFVYGYSERKSNTPIGRALKIVRKTYGPRFMVRTSGDFKSRTMTALSYDDPRAIKQIATKQAFICPVQTGKTDNCGTCGLCWTAQKNVVFMTH